MTHAFDVASATDFLRSRLRHAPKVCVALGSGAGELAEGLSDAVSVPFGDVPGLPPPGVEGHSGRFVGGLVGGSAVLFQSGRYHYYEGHASDVVTWPVRVAAALGVEVIVFTNAAGAIRQDLGPGDLVLLGDHINLTFRSPLIGPSRPDEERFPDMSAPYDPLLERMALDAALASGVALARGTYAAVLGPAYETAAEVRMLGQMGADLVGMSTVPEVIVARAIGMRCLAFSLVTNKATGLGGGPLSHAEVIEVGRQAGARLGRLLAHLIPALDVETQSGSTK